MEWAIDVQYAADLKERQGGACALTGVPLTFDGAYSGIDASLDRIDSTRGYVVGNVQWVHKAINMMKGTLKEPEFVKWCCAVAHKTKW